jgi:hypothetical protein
MTLGGQGQPVAQASTNNRKAGKNKKGKTGAQGVVKAASGGYTLQVGFADLDNLIFHLDGAFDALPNIAAWVAVAAAFDGLWDLCANCARDGTGKKLFRQVNFNRFLNGLGLLTDPSGLAEYPYGPSILVDVHYNTGGTATAVVFSSTNAPQSHVAVFQVGMQLSNIVFDFTGAVYAPLDPSSPLWQLAITLVDVSGGKPPVGGERDYAGNICWSLGDGMPGQNGSFSIHTNRDP